MKRRLQFRTWLEAKDIFGFDKAHSDEQPSAILAAKPIRQFNIELMMEYLSKKKIGQYTSESPFMSEIRWGSDLGCVKLEIDTGLSFYIKKKGKDLQGQDRWVMKKLLQLNRHGYGGLEDSVAQEIFTHLEHIAKEPTPAASNGFGDLENLVLHIYNKMKRNAKDVFIPVGVRQHDENNYILCFDVRGQGQQGMYQQKIEQNQTLVSFDKDAGTLRITNYNIESPLSSRKWQIGINDLDICFFASQDRDEISECLACHIKYY